MGFGGHGNGDDNEGQELDMLLLQQMAVLFFLMVLGYCMRKREILSAETAKFLSWLVVHVANPALILSGSIERTGAAAPKELGMCLGIAVLMFVGLILIAAVVTPLFRVSRESAGTYRIMMIFSNVGFMGFPVIRAVYGSEALLYASLFLIPYNLLIYTYGIREMQGAGAERTKISWKKILNVGVLSCLVALAIAIFQIPTPDFVETAVSSLSGLTAPLSMMVIGASMAEFDVRELFTDRKLLAFSAFKLLVVPVAGMLFIKLFVESEMFLGVCLVMLSTPVGSMTAMLAQQYGGDYELDSKGVALTTLLSVATMPLVSMLVG